MLPATQWFLREVADETMQRLEASMASRGYSAVLQRLLAQRGLVTEEQVERFLIPKLKELSDPFLLPQMDLAVARVFAAVDAQQEVALYGDYDVDGVTSLTLLTRILQAYGLKPRTFLPHRLEEGYGLSMNGLKRLLEEGKPQLLIAVDCGTTAVMQTAWLKEQGVDVLIFDHHEPGPEGLPDVAALVNPKLGEDFHYLCSAGVIFKLAHALLKTRPLVDFDLKDYLDVVALGTVADIVPLVEENRLLVSRGLRILDKTKHVGLQALTEVSAVKPPLTSMDLGFRLGPRLNASGRLDTAEQSLDLMLSRDSSQAKVLAELLDQQNRERQDLEQSIHVEAQQAVEALLAEADPAGLAVGNATWHPGVVGIVASRLVKKYNRPMFVVAFDEDGLGKGSGRSIDGISLVEAINQCRDLLINGGGHEMAAGITLRRENFAAFQERFAYAVGHQVEHGTLEPKLYADVEVRLGELSLEFLSSYELLQPFGAGNPQPLFIALGVEPNGQPTLLKGKHIRFEFYQDGAVRQGIWFNGTRENESLRLPRPPWDVAFHIERNTFQGTTKLQMQIQALRSTAPVRKEMIATAELAT
jgi:single-stranded-DNA-specific exonuclease